MDGDRVCVFVCFFSLLPCCFLLGGALLAIGADRPDGGCDGGGCALRPSLAATVSQTLLNEEDTFHRYVASQPFVRGVEHTLGTTRAAVATLRERVDRQELAAASASASASAAAHHRGGRRAQRQQEEEERAEEAALVDVVRQKRQTKYVF